MFSDKCSDIYIHIYGNKLSYVSYLPIPRMNESVGPFGLITLDKKRFKG